MTLPVRFGFSPWLFWVWRGTWCDFTFPPRFLDSGTRLARNSEDIQLRPLTFFHLPEPQPQIWRGHRLRANIGGALGLSSENCFLRPFQAGGKPSTWFPPGRLVEHFQIWKLRKLTIKHQRWVKQASARPRQPEHSKLRPMSYRSLNRCWNQLNLSKPQQSTATSTDKTNPNQAAQPNKSRQSKSS